jgi:hypothetical protein
VQNKNAFSQQRVWLTASLKLRFVSQAVSPSPTRLPSHGHSSAQLQDAEIVRLRQSLECSARLITRRRRYRSHKSPRRPQGLPTGMLLDQIDSHSIAPLCTGAPSHRFTWFYGRQNNSCICTGRADTIPIDPQSLAGAGNGESLQPATDFRAFLIQAQVQEAKDEVRCRTWLPLTCAPGRLRRLFARSGRQVL